MFFNRLQKPLLLEERLEWGRRLLGNSAALGAGKQMLQTITAVEKSSCFNSNSIHVSLKARKRPSGEVITQEALLQGRHR